MTTNLKQQILRALVDAPSPPTSVEIRQRLINEGDDPGAGKLLAALGVLEDIKDVTSTVRDGRRRFELTAQGKTRLTPAQPSLIR